MKLVFYSLVLNHHQVYLADEFYRLLGDDYAFVATAKCLDNKGVTEDYSTRPYLVRSWESKKSYKKAMSLALNAEVSVLSGHEALPFEKVPMRKGFIPFFIFIFKYFLFSFNNRYDLFTASYLGALLVLFIVHLIGEGYVLSAGSGLFFYFWLLMGFFESIIKNPYVAEELIKRNTL